MNTFRLRVLSMEKTVLDADVASVIAPGSEGFLGILAHHAPLITALVSGPLRMRYPDGRDDLIAVGGGFLEVSGNQATVLADAVERPEEIDVSRAREAEERARRRLRERAPGLDEARAQAALRRAVNRQAVAARGATPRSR